MTLLTSKDNPRVLHWKKLAGDARYRRAQRRMLIEGPHLLAAALERGLRPVAVMATEEAAAREEAKGLLGAKPFLLSKGVMRAVVDAETPQGLAAELAIPEPAGRRGRCVFLEGIQDPGNVGAVLRSAAAFGVARAVLDPGCADPWAPRTLRAGMGGQFALDVVEVEDLGAALDAFEGRVAVTVPRGGAAPGGAGADAWVFGAEGRGLSEAMLQRADLRVTIPMAPGTESLNVAAAAAICLYEDFSRSAG